MKGERRRGGGGGRKWCMGKSGRKGGEEGTASGVSPQQTMGNGRSECGWAKVSDVSLVLAVPV